MALFNRIFDYLTDGMAMAGNAITPVDGKDIAHVACHMAGGATRSDRDQIVLNRSRWCRVVKGVFRAMAVSTILHLS